jgi:hypothetical protein
VTISTGQVPKPALIALINGLAKYKVTMDSGTGIDLLDEGTYLDLRKKNHEEGKKNKKTVLKCETKVVSAGGSSLTVVGKVFLRLDFGQGLTFPALFIVVKKLGVPALLGRTTMTRTEMDIHFRKPYRMSARIKSSGAIKNFPIDASVMEIAQSYLVMTTNEILQAVEQAEAPVTAKQHENHFFGTRGEE